MLASYIGVLRRGRGLLRCEGVDGDSKQGLDNMKRVPAQGATGSIFPTQLRKKLSYSFVLLYLIIVCFASSSVALPPM